MALTRPTAWPIIVLMTVLLSSADARVFWRSGGRGENSGASEALGARIYETMVQINGGRGTLSVFSTDSGLAATLQRAAHLHGQSPPALVYRGDGMGIVVTAAAGRQVRLLVISPGEGNRCIVFRLEQTESDAAQSARTPEKHVLTDLPVYPGSIPLSFLRDEHQRTAIETSWASASDSAAILSYFGSALKRDGWQPAQPDPAPATLATRLYGRGNDLCCVSVQPGERPGEFRITVLQKRSALE